MSVIRTLLLSALLAGSAEAGAHNLRHSQRANVAKDTPDDSIVELDLLGAVEKELHAGAAKTQKVAIEEKSADEDEESTPKAAVEEKVTSEKVTDAVAPKPVDSNVVTNMKPEKVAAAAQPFFDLHVAANANPEELSTDHEDSESDGGNDGEALDEPSSEQVTAEQKATLAKVEEAVSSTASAKPLTGVDAEHKVGMDSSVHDEAMAHKAIAAAEAAAEMTKTIEEKIEDDSTKAAAAADKHVTKGTPDLKETKATTKEKAVQDIASKIVQAGQNVAKKKTDVSKTAVEVATKLMAAKQQAAKPVTAQKVVNKVATKTTAHIKDLAKTVKEPVKTAKEEKKEALKITTDPAVAEVEARLLEEGIKTTEAELLEEGMKAEEAAKAEALKKAAEKAAAEKRAVEQAAAEKAAAEKAAIWKAEKAAEKAEADRKAAEKAAIQKTLNEEVLADKAAAAKKAAEEAAAAKVAAQKRQAEKAAAEKKAAEEAAAKKKAQAEKLAAAQKAAEKAKAQKRAAEKARKEAEQAAKEAAEEQRADEGNDSNSDGSRDDEAGQEAEQEQDSEAALGETEENSDSAPMEKDDVETGLAGFDDGNPDDNMELDGAAN